MCVCRVDRRERDEMMGTDALHEIFSIISRFAKALCPTADNGPGERLILNSINAGNARIGHNCVPVDDL